MLFPPCAGDLEMIEDCAESWAQPQSLLAWMRRLEIGELVPQAIRDRVAQACTPTHPEIAQPITWVPLTVHWIQDTMMINEVPQAGDGEGDNGGSGGGGTAQPRLPGAGTAEQGAQVLINVQRVQQQQAREPS